MELNVTDELRISRSSYSKLKPETKQDLLSVMGLLPTIASDNSSPQAAPDSDEELVRFSERDWRNFIEGVGPKVLSLLDAIADGPSTWNVGQILKKMKVKSLSELRAAQAGLTKRTRTISKRADLALYVSVDWDPEDMNKCRTAMDPSTHAALRRVLGKS
jgi:hypothetical protein